MKPLDQFYYNQQEPIRGTLLAMRHLIMSQDPQLTHELKYGMPFFCYQKKMVCILWIHKVHRMPYLGLVDGKRFTHPGLLVEKRARMKILLIDPAVDLPQDLIVSLVQEALQ